MVFITACQNLATLGFWQLTSTTTSEKESSLLECEVRLRFLTVPGQLLSSHTELLFSASYLQLVLSLSWSNEKSSFSIVCKKLFNSLFELKSIFQEVWQTLVNLPKKSQKSNFQRSTTWPSSLANKVLTFWFSVAFLFKNSLFLVFQLSDSNRHRIFQFL